MINLKQHLFIFPVFFLLIFNGYSQEQTELTGFFDIINNYQPSLGEINGFKINQFEIDISKGFTDEFSFGSAIAYNNENGNIELSMVFLHYNLLTKEIKHPRRTEEDEHAGIVIGKFDVPIGLDYLSFASPDRPVVSQPLIIEKTIGGWNDVGVNLHLNRKYFRFNFSAVNGFNKGVNFAGDLVFKMIPGIKLGLFHTSDFNAKMIRKSWINGAYLMAEKGVFELKSEFIRANGIYGGEADTLNDDHLHDGFYVQLLTDLSKERVSWPIFFTLRYSEWFDENKNSPVFLADKIERYVAGIGWHINTYSSLRLEYQNENPRGAKRFDRLTAQMVVEF